jgi:hypothetical protein
VRPDPFTLVWACAWPPLWAGFWACVRRRLPVLYSPYLAWAITAAVCVIGYGIAGEFVPAAISAFHVMLALVLWWLSRRRRKRAPKLAGAKSRALLAAVVAKLRESLKPRPVLRPVPGGAR